MFKMPDTGGVHVVMEQIRAVLKKEGPEIIKKTMKESLKNDNVFKKEIINLLQADWESISRRAAQGINAAQTLRNNAHVSSTDIYGKTIITGNQSEQDNGGTYKRMKNKINYGVNTGDNSTLTNNGSKKMI